MKVASVTGEERGVPGRRGGETSESVPLCVNTNREDGAESSRARSGDRTGGGSACASLHKE